MSIKNLIIRWYGGNTKYVPVVCKLYILTVRDIFQWLNNGHSIKKYINTHFRKHFNEIYEHRATLMKEHINTALSPLELEDPKILGRLINILDKIFTDICQGELEKSIKANKEYWTYFNNIIKPGFKTQ